MKLLVWNINGLAPTVRNAVLKHGSWLGFFQEHGLDLACLQESKVIDDKLTQELCCVEGYQSFWACSRERKGYSGVATYAAEAWAPLACEADCLGSGDDDIDREGRRAWGVVITDHGAFVLVNVYVPNAGDRPERARLPFKLRFLEALKAKCDALAAAGRQLLIVGDFNVPAEPRDLHPALGPYENSYGEEERAALAGFLAAYPDVWRRLHPEESNTFSVWHEKTSARAFNQGLRIDYVLATPGLLDKVASCEILSAEVLHPKWSDHAGILLELRDVAPPAQHPPCPAWTALYKRFHDTSQRSILSMFGAATKKRPASAAGGSSGAGMAAAAAAGGVAAAGAAAAAAAGSGGQEDGQQQKKARRGAAADAAPAEAAAAGQDSGQPGGSADEAEAARPAAAGSSKQKGSSGGTKPAAKPGGKGKQQQKAPPPGQRTIGAFFAGGGSQ